MLHKKIRIPKDSEVEVMEELGKMDESIQFVDLNSNDYEQRKIYLNMLTRCEEAGKKIQHFENICSLYNEEIIRYNNYQTFKIDLENDMESIDKRYSSTYFDLIENEIGEDEKKLIELLESYKNITEQLDSLIEKKSVFDKSSQLMSSQNYQITLSRDSFPTIKNEKHETIENFLKNKNTIPLIPETEITDINFISGVIKSEDSMRMKRMIFRASRGRAIPTFFDLTIENKALKTKQEKKIFVILYQGGADDFLVQKILKICDMFNSSRFSIPKKEEINSAINAIQHEIYEKKTFLKTAETSIKDFIKDKIGVDGVPGKYDKYRLFFLQEKLVYTNLSKCKNIGNFIDGEVWIPEDKFKDIQNSLLKITEKDPSKLTAILTDFDANDKSIPPTYLKLNDFTYPFQMIISEYGIPRYREINPGLFSIISFPFMFGVMFGDIGHGFLLTLLGAYLVLKSDEIIRTNPSLKMVVKVRYLFLFLGFFAFYNGWIYDDFFSLPLGIFGSCYDNVKNEENGKLEAVRKKNCVYPFGMDPKWYVASNELSFLNSFKMKMSVIIGVSQMILGIFLKGLNGIYFGDTLDFVCEFIPRIIFMCLLFGYMNLLIYIKWATDWSSDTSKAPSIISQLLMIFLNNGSTGEEGHKLPLWRKDDYTIQEKFQFHALVICVICVPIMLIPKPIIEYMKHSEEEDHKKSFTDLMVEQIIGTIEYVLGTVSHTASYLRLWALSLAHAQLSKVFFDITLLGFIQSGNIIGMMLGFFLLANITLGVLMGMDLMECFLHTLRLHWVEFMDKFYHADGYAFQPFSFKYIDPEFI